MIITPYVESPMNYVFSPKLVDSIQSYFDQFDSLSRDADWKTIVSLGQKAIEVARAENRFQDEAKICAQLTSTTFYMGDYDQALIYANRCHELSQEFTDPSLYLRALYLESAVYRALAGKNEDALERQNLFRRAVEICAQAEEIYNTRGVVNSNLLGKIYFNWGAALADNPEQVDLTKAAEYYTKALDCFNEIKASDDVIRTSLRLGKVYLLQRKYDLTQKILEDVQPLITNGRIKMQSDYLEAQLLMAIDEIEAALTVARVGLLKAVMLGAKEDERRFLHLIQVLKEEDSI